MNRNFLGVSRAFESPKKSQHVQTKNLFKFKSLQFAYSRKFFRIFSTGSNLVRFCVVKSIFIMFLVVIIWKLYQIHFGFWVEILCEFLSNKINGSLGKYLFRTSCYQKNRKNLQNFKLTSNGQNFFWDFRPYRQLVGIASIFHCLNLRQLWQIVIELVVKTNF